MDKIKNLVEKISHYNNLYYNENISEISDAEYDKLIKELRTLDPTNEIFNYCGSANYGEKIKHSQICGSLKKIHNVEELPKEFNGSICITPKIDGCALCLFYEKGKLKLAITRGDGVTGENVTANAFYIDSIPKTIPIKCDLEIRGECIITKSNFEKIKHLGFSNCRNTASGSLKLKDPKLTKDRKLDFIAYDVVSTTYINDYSEILVFLKELGFLTPQYFKVEKLESEKIISILKEIKNTDYDFVIDGAVLKVDDIDYYKSLGYSNKNPRGAVAFKYYTEQQISTILAIEWNTTRTGRVVPVAIIEPTEISETIVERVTLNNYQWIIDRKITTGDTIKFEKANEIIPKYIETISHAKNTLEIPKTCNICNTELETSGVDLICPNDLCGAKTSKHIEYMLKILNCKGISAGIINRLLDHSIIKDVHDILNISQEELLFNGFKEKESSNIIKSISKLYQTPISKALLFACLGIKNWSTSTFEAIDIEELLKICFLAKSKEELNTLIDSLHLEQYDGISTLKINALKNELYNKRELLKKLNNYLNIEDSINKLQNDNKQAEFIEQTQFTNKTFCVTGSFNIPRNELASIIKEMGGIFKNSVTKNLDFLIVGEKPGSKKEKAIKNGCKIIEKEELNELLSGKLNQLEKINVSQKTMGSLVEEFLGEL